MSDNKGKEKYILEKHKYNNEKWKTYFFSSLAALIALLISFFNSPDFLGLIIPISFFLFFTIFAFLGFIVHNKKLYHFLNTKTEDASKEYTVDNEWYCKLWKFLRRQLCCLIILFVFLFFFLFTVIGWEYFLSQKLSTQLNFIIGKILAF